EDALPPGTLSTLFDRLADDPELYTALSAQDETFTGPPPERPAEVFAEAEPVLPVMEEAIVEPEPVTLPAETLLDEPAAVEESEPEDDPIAAMIASIDAKAETER